MPRNASKLSPSRVVVVLSFVPCAMGIPQAAWALCNGGVTVTGALTVSASCAGGNVKPLTLDTGANVTVNAGVTVSNDAPANRNGDAISVLSSSTSGTVTNNGTISTGQQVGVWINGTLTNLTNNGLISSSVRRGIVVNGGTLVNLTNTGSITGPFAGVTNTGRLQTFNNLQGAGNPKGAVTYTGALPTDYRIIINSPTAFGKLSAAGVTGSMTFGIYGTSNVAVGTYANVLSGLASSNLTGPTSGVFGGFNWLLGPASGSSTTWDLVLTNLASNFTLGSTYALSALGTSANPVFDGGTLTLTAGDNSSQAFVINSAGGVITTPAGGSARLSGIFSGVGGMTVNGTGTLVLSGNNTYSGGTSVSAGTLVISGNALGSGPVFVAPGARLMGNGAIGGALTVAGTLKPGNSPGYIVANSTVTMNGGSTYQQDIAGTVSAGPATPIGASGTFSLLNVANGQFVIQPNATLTPRLTNLFVAGEAGFGATPYTPVLGDRFRIVTAAGGLSGRFSTLTQPTELAAGTQFIQFYNAAGSNSIDLALIPTSYATTLTAQSGNTRSAAVVLDRLVAANQTGSANAAQDQLLYAASGQTADSMAAFARRLSGEIHGATLAAVPQTTLRLQQSVMSRLSDASAEMTASGSSNAIADPGAPVAGATESKQGWAEMVYQHARRTGDAAASGFSSNLTQLILGVEPYARDGVKIGGGISLANTNVNAEQGVGTIQQGSLFAYSRLPLDGFVLDGMASVGLHTTNTVRTDPVNAADLQGTARGNDALLSAGMSLPMALQNTRVKPYARVTWQRVSQSSFGEGSSVAALNVNRFVGDGVRGLIGVTVESSPTKSNERFAYQANLALGADTSNLINPGYDASLAGVSMTGATPGVGAAFVQAGFSGIARFNKNAFAYLGLSAETRAGASQGNINMGVRIKF